MVGKSGLLEDRATRLTDTSGENVDYSRGFAFLFTTIVAFGE